MTASVGCVRAAIEPDRVRQALTKGPSSEMTIQGFEVIDAIPAKTFQRASLGR